MKQYTTKYLKSVAVFYLGFPVFYLFVSALLFDIPAGALLRILLSPFYYLVSLLAMIVGYALWEVHRWGWYLFLITNFLIGYQNAIIVNEYGTTHHKVVAFFASIFGMILIIFRVAREIRVPYFFPKIRWWESNPRYKLLVPVKLTRVEGSTLEGEIMDLSMGGCFIKLKAEIHQHEPVQLKFSVFHLPIECQGIIVWQSQSTVTTPKGIGVKFMPFSRAQKRTLRQIMARLKRVATLYRKSRYILSQEEFLKRLNELEEDFSRPRTRRKGLIG